MRSHWPVLWLTALGNTPARIRSRLGESSGIKAIVTGPHPCGRVFASRVQEVFKGHGSLIQNGTESPFRKVAGVIRNGSVAVRFGVEPDFMATGSLAIKTETKHLEAPNDLTVTESRESTQSGIHDDHEIAALFAGWQGRRSLTLATRLNQFPGHVPCNFQGFSDSSALSD